MGSVMSSKKSKEELEIASNKAKEIASSSSVVIFSCKTICVEEEFQAKDAQGDGSDIQLALAEWTGLRTVPNVFIGGKHIGGCDTVLEKHRAGQLVPLLNDAGAIANNSAQL
ncbi:hypothetical protein TanjilG_15783 [Lupinus angustifolius]|uniref:Glutaredoxin domain-containing protein n=1 Tax=Lupinus angustifolius TaxID=3871 RepID=A0A1J7HRG8_LUPAN|nr:hypothetical protein TanjilG_15783 [Lupinus angustifolius]